MQNKNFFDCHKPVDDSWKTGISAYLNSQTKSEKYGKSWDFREKVVLVCINIVVFHTHVNQCCCVKNNVTWFGDFFFRVFNEMA